jgi:hypothetical protein
MSLSKWQKLIAARIENAVFAPSSLALATVLTGGGFSENVVVAAAYQTHRAAR